MSSKTRFPLLLAAALVVGLLLGLGAEGPRVLELELVPEVLAAKTQGASGRRFVAKAWSEATNVLAASSVEPLAVAALHLGPDGALFAFEPGTGCVVVLAAPGRETLRLCAGMGRASDFGIDPAGQAWLALEVEARLVRLSPTEDSVASLPLEEPAHRIAPGAQGAWFSMPAPDSAHLFARHRADGALEARFGQVLAGAVQPRLALDGSLVPDGRGGLVYAPYFLDVLLAYRGDGSLRWAARTVVGGALIAPSVVERPGGGSTLAPGTPWTSIAAHVVGGQLHVLADADLVGGERQRVLDVYGLEDGAYSHSLRLPVGPRDALLRGAELLTLGKTAVLAWPAREDAG